MGIISIMKGGTMKIRLLVSVILIIPLVITCSKVQTVKKVLPAKSGSLAIIDVYNAADERVSGTQIANVGGILEFVAKGKDASGRAVDINPTWSCDDPEAVEITPEIGPKVKIKILKECLCTVTAEAGDVKAEISIGTQ